jgi:hypothetical protein
VWFIVSRVFNELLDFWINGLLGMASACQTGRSMPGIEMLLFVVFYVSDEVDAAEWNQL